MTEKIFPNLQRESADDFFSDEEFVAFFDMRLPVTGNSSLSGLCKVARPKGNPPKVNYISLTFIFDTPNAALHNAAEKSIAKLTGPSFARYIPEVNTITSVPCTNRQAETYIHQMDLVLAGTHPPDIITTLRHIVFTIRQSGGFQTEAPQLWEEGAAPKPSSVEKANWASRFKALTRVFGKS